MPNSHQRRHYSSPNIILATGKSTRNPSSLTSTSPTIKEEEEETITVSRSDGVHHDLLSVYGRPGIANVISSSSLGKLRAHSMDEGSSAKNEAAEEEEKDVNRINITRSDGMSHDIVKVFRASGDSARSAKLTGIDASTLTISPTDYANTNTAASAAAAADNAQLEQQQQSVGTPHTPHTPHGHGYAEMPSAGPPEKIKAGRSSTFAKIADLLTGKSRAQQVQEKDGDTPITRRSFTGLDNTPIVLPPQPPATQTSISLSRNAAAEYFLKSVRIVHMSDTHGLLKATERSAFLPHGHILVHTGNFTNFGREEEFVQFNNWLMSVSDIYHYRIVLLGHKDVKVFGQNFDAMKKLLTAATHVLCHEECTVLGVRFYGVPWNYQHRKNYTVRFGATQSMSNGRFEDIPSNLHVLLTHGPAYGRLDSHFAGEVKEHWGSRELAEAIQRRRPQVHLHGHVKDCRGVIPAFANNPLVVNGCVTNVDATVICAAPTVIKATQVLHDAATNTVSWSFSIDSLDG